MKIRRLRLSVTNFYLVETNDQRVLVDTGYEFPIEALKRNLGKHTRLVQFA